MSGTVIFGCSGSGKSTLARSLAKKGVAHLDLDELAWLPTHPPERMSRVDSQLRINGFLEAHENWVIEGCYADLIKLVLDRVTHLIFLDLPIATCIEHCRQRPFEPHKYESKQAQDANLDMLINWIEQYPIRQDELSHQAHQQLFQTFSGKKTRYQTSPLISP